MNSASATTEARIDVAHEQADQTDHPCTVFERREGRPPLEKLSRWCVGLIVADGYDEDITAIEHVCIFGYWYMEGSRRFTKALSNTSLHITDDSIAWLVPKAHLKARSP